MHQAFTERWVSGWATSRRLALRPDGDGWHVTVDAPTRREEYVVAEPSGPEALRLARLVADDPASWLTVIGAAHRDAHGALHALDRIGRVETVMQARLTPSEVPDGVLLEEDGEDVAHVRIEVDGQLAARGQVAVRGRDAVADRIETEEAFRRRGLGRRVMTALTAWATAHGADRGLLLASEQGRALYRSLGWTDVTSATTYRGIRLPSASTHPGTAGRPGSRP